MKKAIILLVVWGALLLAPSVHAAPEVPNAPVDLWLVTTIYQNRWDNPGVPGVQMRVWAGIWNTSQQSQTIWVGLFDHQTYQWIIYSSSALGAGWFYLADWYVTPKNIPDSYEIYLYYWQNGVWQFADKAVGWVQAEQEHICHKNPHHCPFSPNFYNYPTMWDYGDYKYVHQYFWYHDYAPASGSREGTDRLNRLRQYTSGFPHGKFQVEFRRVNSIAGQQSVEGWDALYDADPGPRCDPANYPDTATNLPNPSWHSEEIGSDKDCDPLENDEEAQADTANTEGMQLYTGGNDPTLIPGTVPNPPGIYWVQVQFYRLPAYRNQTFTLQTEFELLHGGVLYGVDVIFSTQYPGTPF